MDEVKMAEAWERFEKAVRFEEKSNEPGKSDSMKAMALRQVDKLLAEAVALEAEALA